MTILLSVCFFLTILSEFVPTTSESIPLLGVFFSAITIIVSMSTCSTVLVLNLRYRQISNHKMSNTVFPWRSTFSNKKIKFRYIFLDLLPWLMLIKRPGYQFRRKNPVKKNLQGACVQARKATLKYDFLPKCKNKLGENY